MFNSIQRRCQCSTLFVVTLFTHFSHAQQKESQVPAPLKSAKFTSISRNQSLRDNSTLSAGNTKLHTEFKPGHTTARATIELVFDISDRGGNFASPIVVSKNPKIVKVAGVGKIAPPKRGTVRSGRCTATVEAKPVTSVQSVGIDCIWNGVTKKLKWTLAPYNGPNYVRQITVSPTKASLGDVVSIVVHLDFEVTADKRVIEYKIEPSNAFSASGSTSYSSNASTYNTVVIPRGDDAAEIRLKVEQPGKTVSVNTWVDRYRGENPRDRRYKRKDFTIAKKG